jgi:tripartite-type tricarboxylate transporter receptor subunit TctC
MLSIPKMVACRPTIRERRSELQSTSGAPMKNLFLCAVAAIAVSNSAHADSTGHFYNGKVIRVLSSGVGGSYDAYARLLARHLPDHLGGGAKAIVESMPGASVRLPLYLHDVVPTDGAVVAVFNNAIAFAPLLGVAQANFDPTKFNWLGSPSTEIGLVVVRKGAAVNSIQDAMKQEVLMGVGSGGSSASFFGALINAVLGTKFKMLAGYQGIASVYHAMDQGEIDGAPSALVSDLMLSRPDWITGGKAKILLQYGGDPSSRLPGVPDARDLVKNDEDRQLLDAGMAPLEMGRPFAMAPHAPPEAVREMRAAVMSTFKDPVFLADAKQLRFDIDATPKTGDDLLKIIAAVYDAPQPVRDRLVKLYKDSGN